VSDTTTSQDGHKINSPGELYVAGHSFEAHAIRGFLEEAGIYADVMGDSLQGLHAGVHYTFPRVWVNQSQIGRATRILRGYQSAIASRPGNEAGTSSWLRVVSVFILCAWLCGFTIAITKPPLASGGSVVFAVSVFTLLAYRALARTAQS